MMEVGAPTGALPRVIGILARRWLLVATLVIVTVGAAAAYSFSKTPVYRASMKIVVGQGQGIFLPEAGNVAEQFTQTMNDLLQSDIVAREVISSLGLNISPSELLSNLSVSTKPLAAVLEVSYDDTDRGRALRVIEETGEVFTNLVADRLATPDAGAGGTAAVSATIFDSPHLLPDPVEPKPLVNIVVATLLGLALGVGAALLKEQMDDTIRTVQDAEEALEQSETAVLPPGLLGWRPLRPDPKGRVDPVIAELALRRLRANILWSWGSREARSLLVTSAAAEEGKSTVAASLAVSIAREGYSVVAVDADLRRPSMHEFLGVAVSAATKGVDAVLRGETNIDSALINVPLPHRTDDGAGAGSLKALLLTPGQVKPLEPTLDEAVELIKRLTDIADYVVFDGPPLLLVTDIYPLAAAADSVIVTVRAGKSTRKSAAALNKSLSKLRVRSVRKAELVVTEAEAPFTGAYAAYETRTEAPARGRLKDAVAPSPPPPPPPPR